MTKPTQPLEGFDKMLGDRKIPRELWTRIPLPRLAESDYRVDVPELNIKGCIVKIPTISFTRTPRVQFMVPLNY